MPSLKKISYEDRLKKLDLTTLELRRTRGDLIEPYKILTDKEKIDSNQFFKLNNTGYDLRGHSKKLTVKRSRLDTRKYFFSNRLVNHWNYLPQAVVDAPSVNTFKNWLDKYWKAMVI